MAETCAITFSYPNSYSTYIVRWSTGTHSTRSKMGTEAFHVHLIA